MARQAKATKGEKKDKPKDTEQDFLGKFLVAEKDHHFNFEETVSYLVSTGSLIMDTYLKGFGSGFHRFVGPHESGKTSEALLVLKNFLGSVPNSKGVYVKAEGRLSPQVDERSGLKFVYTAEDWVDGTVFVYECNVYESVANLMVELMEKNPNNKRYCVIVDSVDSLIPLADVDREFKDSNKVAGGAVIASNMSRRLAIPWTKRGHMCILLSQVRSSVPTSSYGGGTLRQIVSTGGNALLHYPDMIWQFELRFKDDRILLKPDLAPDPATNPIIGHWVKVTVKKSPHEKSEMTFRYPVKYGRTGGKSVWIELEIFQLLIGWGEINKKGSWLNFDEALQAEIEEAGHEFPAAVQGIANFQDALNERPELSSYLFEMLKKRLQDAV